jgi:hypothetical protein
MQGRAMVHQRVRVYCVPDSDITHTLPHGLHVESACFSASCSHHQVYGAPCESDVDSGTDYSAPLSDSDDSMGDDGKEMYPPEYFDYI